MILKNLYCQNRAIGRISIVSSSSSIQLFRVLGSGIQNRFISSKTFVPAFKRRLLIIVTIKKISVGYLTFNFNKNERSKVLSSVRDNLDFGSLDT